LINLVFFILSQLFIFNTFYRFVFFHPEPFSRRGTSGNQAKSNQHPSGIQLARPWIPYGYNFSTNSNPNVIGKLRRVNEPGDLLLSYIGRLLNMLFA